MEILLKKIRVEVNPKLYLKDPFSSELGAAIVNESVRLVNETGMESFTFKKLAGQIGSTEPAVYRYFENKHSLLLYLSAWYWAWMEYNLGYATANLPTPQDRLKVAIHLLVDGPIYRKNDFLDPSSLHRLVVNESIKGYLTKSVDEEHKSGLFAQVYKFGETVARIIADINPGYRFPKTLVSTVMESSLLQSFNSRHLPGMTETTPEGGERLQFFHQLVTNAISHDQ